jgi:hypothetical protein
MLKRRLHPPHEHVSQSQTYKIYICSIIITDVYHQYEVHALLCCHSVRFFSVYLFTLCAWIDKTLKRP